MLTVDEQNDMESLVLLADVAYARRDLPIAGARYLQCLDNYAESILCKASSP
jgi:hypothetical protein